MFVTDPSNMQLSVIIHKCSKTPLWVQRIRLLQSFIHAVFLIVMHISQVSKKPSYGVNYVRVS